MENNLGIARTRLAEVLKENYVLKGTIEENVKENDSLRLSNKQYEYDLAEYQTEIERLEKVISDMTALSTIVLNTGISGMKFQTVCENLARFIRNIPTKNAL
jgi:regulator of replication initiation timing